MSALVYRGPHPGDFGLLVLLRGTITLVGYSSLGLGPAMVRMLAAPPPFKPFPAPGDDPTAPDAAPPDRAPTDDVRRTATPARSTVLEYQVPTLARRPDEPNPFQIVYSSGACLATTFTIVAALGAYGYSTVVDQVHVLGSGQRWDAEAVVISFGLGTALRVLGEPMSAALQAGGRLAVDNVLLAGGEALWLALVVANGPPTAPSAAGCWMLAAVAVLFARALAVRRFAPAARVHRPWFRRATATALVTFGAGVLVAQLADFLYAPAAYVVINRLLGSFDLIAYAPAVQIDGALLLLVGGLAAALFPRVAAAHAAGDLAAVRRYYVRGTLAGGAALAAAAVATFAFAGPLFTLWLGNGMPETRAILPLVLVHTVVGGTAAVGRSVLLGTGRVRALTVSALIAGAANVALAVTFAAGFGWGLRGVVLATVVVVVARAGVWMPWYVLRTLRRERAATPRWAD
ncbi:MAG: hypothetical protein JWO31_1569 [Phycisphaerales bacterium]|nr:hypothetical protein [Phycisphaerales bacterium]